MKIAPTPIEGIVIVESELFADQRGTFSRWFCVQDLADIVGKRRIVQINYSCTDAIGAVRGLHYQRAPACEMKFVRCIRGRVWDVAVDLRVGSPTFLQWYAEELTPGNARMMVVPKGCAHGFQALEANSELLYLHTAAYEPATEGGIRHDDPAISVAWPLPVSDISERDRNHPLLKPAFKGFTL